MHTFDLSLLRGLYPSHHARTEPISPHTVSPPQPLRSSSPTSLDLDLEMPDIGCITSHDDLPPLLHEILPREHTYIFKEVKISYNSDCGLLCSAIILTDVTMENSAVQWIHDLEEGTKTTFRITRGAMVTGKRIIFKTIRHCQHKRKDSKKSLLRDKNEMSCSLHFESTQPTLFYCQQTYYTSL